METLKSTNPQLCNQKTIEFILVLKNTYVYGIEYDVTVDSQSSACQFYCEFTEQCNTNFLLLCYNTNFHRKIEFKKKHCQYEELM